MLSLHFCRLTTRSLTFQTSVCLPSRDTRDDRGVTSSCKRSGCVFCVLGGVGRTRACLGLVTGELNACRGACPHKDPVDDVHPWVVNKTAVDMPALSMNDALSSVSGWHEDLNATGCAEVTGWTVTIENGDAVSFTEF